MKKIKHIPIRKYRRTFKNKLQKELVEIIEEIQEENIDDIFLKPKKETRHVENKS